MENLIEIKDVYKTYKLGKIENNKAEILSGIKQNDLIVLNHYDIYSTKQKIHLWKNFF